ncbi:serine/threonine protein kinase [Phytophthora nicotianae CJ01A1]|uniref:Serine/threonine protein kinase n=3 Tax=Phytophthora nicotianae TaxID=4792 RepID=W2XP46_PHYNI|nr:serine/threonine protein kinase [Phytophthora nicotianae CJ01A1]
MVTPSPSIDFIIPGLSCLLSEALVTAADHCHDMRENQHMCIHVCDRLHGILRQFSDTNDNSRGHFGDIVTSFVNFLLKRSELSFIKRLANNRKVEETILSFHEDIDRLLLSMEKNLADWRQQWMIDRQNTLEEFEALANNNQVLTAEKGSTSFMEGLFMLKFELNYKADKYRTDAIAEHHLQLMRRTLNKLLRMSNVKLPAIPEWFIPRDDVDFNANMSFDCGSYGSVHRGMWSKGATGGKGAKVVIKCLLVDNDAAKESFYKEMDVWRQLDHPHVLKFYGACHVSSPAFFVCDDATHGSFGEFFEEDKSQMWRLFYEAALGLGYLHTKKVVHGDLKCNNLLVGSDYKAKLCDFGFSYVRSQSVGLSAKSQTEAIRWKAPECLMPPDEDPKPQFNPRFASDVYSLGMCIIEAFLGEAPYGIMDDDEIMTRLFDQEPYPRPGGMKDDEWTLVEKLIQPDWTKRISLTDAIDELKRFADREEEQSARTAATRECSTCEASMPIEFAFCGNCGTSMTRADETSQAAAASAQQKNACPRCEENVVSTDHFCRHCGYCLDADPAFV